MRRKSGPWLPALALALLLTGCGPAETGAKTDGGAEIPEEFHRLYLYQIAEAQTYLNENHQADLSHTQCLLRRMLPAPYHEAIDRLRERQDARVIYNIYGGVHQHVPNATHAEQRKDT